MRLRAFQVKGTARAKVPRQNAGHCGQNVASKREGTQVSGECG